MKLMQSKKVCYFVWSIFWFYFHFAIKLSFKLFHIFRVSFVRLYLFFLPRIFLVRFSFASANDLQFSQWHQTQIFLKYTFNKALTHSHTPKTQRFTFGMNGLKLLSLTHIYTQMTVFMFIRYEMVTVVFGAIDVVLYFIIILVVYLCFRFVCVKFAFFSVRISPLQLCTHFCLLLMQTMIILLLCIRFLYSFKKNTHKILN